MRLDPTPAQPLEWRQPELLRRCYQLTADGRDVATLRFENSFGSLATGQYGPAAWTFKRTGFLSPRVSVREAGSPVDLALFTPGWTGAGWVAFQSGLRCQLRHTNFWGTAWSFENQDGSTLVALSAHPGFIKEVGIATVPPAAAGLPETPVLLLLIWYLRVLMHADASAAVVVAAG